VGQVVESLAQVKRRVHQVETDVEPGLVALIDPQGLEQALGHLVQNAIDASPAGVPVTVCVRTSGGDVAIEVADRGAGMSAEFVRSRLFQPFASTKDNGFGVGAFEARSLIAAMGGRLDVESREGEGTRFTVFLPLASTSNAFSDQRMCA
jgi:signal transduction histidine kinase